jgi:hypothetical protein
MAEAMGVSPSSVKRAEAAGLLPVVRDGRKLRFRRTETQTIEIGGGIRQRGPALEREARGRTGQRVLRYVRRVRPY